MRSHLQNQNSLLRFVMKIGYEHVQWLNLSPGPKNVSNKKIKANGLTFLDPDAKRDSENLLD